MAKDKTQEERYFRAAKKVKDIKGFYTHLAIYCFVISILIFINLNYDPSYHWFWFSLLGWGFGLTMHWFNVFGFRFIGLGKDWEDKKIKEYMNQEKN